MSKKSNGEAGGKRRKSKVDIKTFVLTPAQFKPLLQLAAIATVVSAKLELIAGEDECPLQLKLLHGTAKHTVIQITSVLPDAALTVGAVETTKLLKYVDAMFSDIEEETLQ